MLFFAGLTLYYMIKSVNQSQKPIKLNPPDGKETLLWTGKLEDPNCPTKPISLQIKAFNSVAGLTIIDIYADSENLGWVTTNVNGNNFTVAIGKPKSIK